MTRKHFPFSLSLSHTLSLWLFLTLSVTNKFTISLISPFFSFLSYTHTHTHKQTNIPSFLLRRHFFLSFLCQSLSILHLLLNPTTLCSVSQALSLFHPHSHTQILSTSFSRYDSRTHNTLPSPFSINHTYTHSHIHSLSHYLSDTHSHTHTHTHIKTHTHSFSLSHTLTNFQTSKEILMMKWQFSFFFWSGHIWKNNLNLNF